MYAWDTAGRLYTWGVDCPPVNPFPRVLHSYPRSISYGSDNASTPWVIAPSSCPVPPKSSTSNGFLARRIFHSCMFNYKCFRQDLCSRRFHVACLLTLPSPVLPDLIIIRSSTIYPLIKYILLELYFHLTPSISSLLSFSLNLLSR